MHPRHRSPGDGVVSNSVGIGTRSGRVSPEGSIRVHGMFNPEYRNLRRGFGRGQPKPHPPLPPPRKADIFMEAGRLAAEYLVFKGLLPPNSHPGKWQNGTLNVQMNDFEEVRAQDRESLPMPMEGRTPGLARFRNALPDIDSGRRRYVDEFGSIGSRSNARGRRRMGPYRGYGSDWGRGDGRSPSWSERTRSFTESIDSEDDYVGGYPGVRHSTVEGTVASKVVADEFSSKSEAAEESESELDTCEFPNDDGSKVSSSTAKKDLPPKAATDLDKERDVAGMLRSETGEAKHGLGDDQVEKENAQGCTDKEHCSVENDLVIKQSVDLPQLCSLSKEPTGSRSLSTSSVLKGGQDTILEEKNILDLDPSMGSKISSNEDSVEGSSNDSPANRNHSPKSFFSEISRPHSVQSMDNIGNLDPAFVMEGERCTKSHSFSDRSSFMHQHESSHGPPGFGRSKSMVMSSEEESSAQHLGTREGTKRSREWFSSGAPEDDDLFRLHNLRAKHSNSQIERCSPDKEMVEAADQEELIEVALFPEEKAVPSAERSKEKQFLPRSYKICDLNLMEAAEVAGSPIDPVLDHTSSVASDRGADTKASLDFALSINNFNNSHSYNGQSSDAKEVMIIDVEDVSPIEEKVFDASEQKTDTMYSNLESFMNQTENTDVIPNAQDGYNFEISELLEADVPHCSSVPVGANDLQNEMTIPNEEEIPVDDDPIYLSLGEIPISLLGVWDPPTLDYGKPH